jgi:integrase
MMSRLPANVAKVSDRHGKARYRFRRKGWDSAYVKGEPDTAEFHASYAEILAGGPREVKPAASPAKVEPKSLDDLLARMKASPGWLTKTDRTRHVQAQVYERYMNRLDPKGRRFGSRPVENVTVGWLDKIFGGMADTPGAANDLRKKLGVLLDYAIGLEWRKANPIRHTTKFKEGPGIHTWSEAEIAQYRARHPNGTAARLTLELALNTAGRRCNIARLTRDDITNGSITTAHVKDNNPATVPVLHTTKAALDALPATPIKFLIVSAHGKPFTVNGMGNKMRQWCDEAGLPQCSIHGLRKALSRRIAESRGTDAEGQAVTGHKKGETFAAYRAEANRTALAATAMSNLALQFDVQPEEMHGETDA